MSFFNGEVSGIPMESSCPAISPISSSSVDVNFFDAEAQATKSTSFGASRLIISIPGWSARSLQESAILTRWVSGNYRAPRHSMPNSFLVVLLSKKWSKFLDALLS